MEYMETRASYDCCVTLYLLLILYLVDHGCSKVSEICVPGMKIKTDLAEDVKVI